MAPTRGLGLISNSGHSAVQKLWILQHLLVPHFWWHLLIYEIPIYVVKNLEQQIFSCIRDWLCLHNRTTNIPLYTSSSLCPLPIKSLSSILKSAKVSDQLLLWDSADPCVSEGKVLLKSGNCSASEVLEKTKKRSSLKQILGYHQSERAGFGSTSIPKVLPKHSYAYRKLLASIVEQAQHTRPVNKMVQLCSYGSFEEDPIGNASTTFMFLSWCNIQNTAISL